MSVNTETSSLKKELSNANSNGTSVGQSATDKVGFYGVTPIAQRSGSAQGAVATTAITPVATTAITPVTTTAITAVATTASTSTSPYGFSSTQADALVAAVNSIITRLGLTYAAANSLITQGAANVTAVNSLITQGASGVTISNELRAALVALGLIKGSA